MTTVTVILSVFIILAIIYIFVLLRPEKRKLESFFCRPYAHRGLHDREVPENSLAAFRAAAEAGYGIELDLQLSSDGEVMVMHDYSLKRMTGEDVKLSDLTCAELKKLSLSGTSEKIPTLHEVLEEINGRVPLLIELKGESTDISLCPAADAVLSGYSGGYIVESFNPMMLAWYKKKRPDIPRGVLITDICRENGLSIINFALSGMFTNILSRPNFIAYDLRRRNLLPIWICKKVFAIPRFGWTVKTEEAFEISKSERAFPIFEEIKPDKECVKL